MQAMADCNDVFGDDDCPPWLIATQETECHPIHLISSIIPNQVQTSDYACVFVQKHSLVFKLLQGSYLDKALSLG